jgi:thioredoxin reductase
MDCDCIVVGAGPAGLSAALILGRCRRQVVVLDTDRPRNAASSALNGFLTRDGTPPRKLLRIARQQLSPYKTVRLLRKEATRARCVPRGFEVTLADGSKMRCRKLLLATGVVDEVPPIEGLAPLYGRSVFHCPYCDGWESRERPIVVYSRSSDGVGLAIGLLIWSRDIVLCTDGVSPPRRHLDRLKKYDIAWRRERVQRLEGAYGRLRRVIFVDGQTLDREVMFFSAGQRQASNLARQLGCAFTNRGAVRTGAYEASDVSGVYVAGDASRLVQLAIVAAAEGAQAAFAINTDLIKEDFP